MAFPAWLTTEAEPILHPQYNQKNIPQLTGRLWGTGKYRDHGIQLIRCQHIRIRKYPESYSLPQKRHEGNAFSESVSAGPEQWYG